VTEEGVGSGRDLPQSLAPREARAMSSLEETCRIFDGQHCLVERSDRGSMWGVIPGLARRGFGKPIGTIVGMASGSMRRRAATPAQNQEKAMKSVINTFATALLVIASFTQVAISDEHKTDSLEVVVSDGIDPAAAFPMFSFSLNAGDKKHIYRGYRNGGKQHGARATITICNNSLPKAGGEMRVLYGRGGGGTFRSLNLGECGTISSFSIWVEFVGAPGSPRAGPARGVYVVHDTVLDQLR